MASKIGAVVIRYEVPKEVRRQIAYLVDIKLWLDTPQACGCPDKPKPNGTRFATDIEIRTWMWLRLEAALLTLPVVDIHVR